jgi:peptide/nickel transport system permease protein
MGMTWYVVRRVLWAFVVTFIIVSVTWGLLAVSPKPAIIEAGQAAAQRGESAEAAEERLRELKGYDRPLYVRYTDYMTDVFTLRWGWSDTRAQPVKTAVVQSLYYTAQYSIPWTLMVMFGGTAMGLFAAGNQYSYKDHVTTLVAFFGYSLPNFWFGLMILLIFGVRLEWIPITYNTDVAVFSLENAVQLSAPVFVLVTGSVGGMYLAARNESAEYVNADFVKTAKAKGVGGSRIFSRHILRPAAVPLSTIYVAQMLAIFSGSSVLIEVVFSIPGLGRLLFRALTEQDLSLILGTSFVFIFIAVIGNLLQDITYTVLDPRIEYGDR